MTQKSFIKLKLSLQALGAVALGRRQVNNYSDELPWPAWDEFWGKFQYRFLSIDCCVKRITQIAIAC